MTDELAVRDGDDPALNVTYVGQFMLANGEVEDGYHVNAAGQESLSTPSLRRVRSGGTDKDSVFAGTPAWL